MTAPRRLEDLRGKPAAAFIRVSTDQQNLSPATQRRLIDRFARNHGISLIRTVELTISGKDAWRDPAVTEITQDAEAGRIAAVIVSTLDRMGRSPRTDIFIDDLTAAGAVLIDADNELTSGNPSHRRTMRTGIAAATNEREIIRERVTNGIRDRNETHNDQWGRPPFGFTRTGGEPSLLQIDPATIRQLIDLFELYASGNVSIDDLARNHAPIVQHGPTAGRPMTREGIASLLANPIYNGFRDNPPISDELWQQTQTVLQQRRRGGGSPTRPPTGLRNLHCADCGQRLRLDGAGGAWQHPRIRHLEPCAEWLRPHPTPRRGRPPGERRSLTHAIKQTDWMLNHLDLTDAAIVDLVAYLTADDAQGPKITPIAHRRQKERISRELIAGYIDAHEAQRRLDAVRTAEALARPATARRDAPTAAEVVAALHDWQETYQDASASARAALAAATFERIELSAGDVTSVTLTDDADQRGMWRALPEGIPQRWLACPRGLEPPTFRSAT